MSFDLLYTCFKISDVKIKQIEYCLIKSADGKHTTEEAKTLRPFSAYKGGNQATYFYQIK